MNFACVFFLLFLCDYFQKGELLLTKNEFLRTRARKADTEKCLLHPDPQTMTGKYYICRGVICLLYSDQNRDAENIDWKTISAPKLDFEECYYSVLEVPVDVEFAGLKKAYHRLVFHYHADRKTNDREKTISNRQMQVINAAYTVLRNSVTRRLYDERRQRGLFGIQAQIKISESNAADRKATNSQDTKSSRLNSFRESFNATGDSDVGAVDLERMKGNVQEVWNDYLKRKHGSTSDPFTTSRQATIRSAVQTVTNAAVAAKEVTAQKDGKQRHQMKQLEIEREYEEEENENQEIYSTLTRLRSLPYNKVAVKNGLLYLYRLKEHKMAQLNRDKRDWGEVTLGDELLVEQRLRSINALRAIHALIGDMEEKLRVIARSFSEMSDGSDEWDDLWDNTRDPVGGSNYYRNRDGYPPNQPRPQPQPKR